MKNKISLISSTCIAALVCLPLTVFSADKKTSSPAAPASPAAKTGASPAAAKQSRPLPFHGTISAVDQSAKTFTIAGKEKSRVFKVTANTAITKDGKSATMADISANIGVSGSYWKHDDESLEAKSVKIGGAPAKKEKAADEGKKSKAAASPAVSASPKPY